MIRRRIRRHTRKNKRFAGFLRGQKQHPGTIGSATTPAANASCEVMPMATSTRCVPNAPAIDTEYKSKLIRVRTNVCRLTFIGATPVMSDRRSWVPATTENPNNVSIQSVARLEGI